MTEPATTSLASRGGTGGFWATYTPPRTTPLGKFTPAASPGAVEVHARSAKDPVVVSVGLDAPLLHCLREALEISDDEDALDMTRALDEALGRRGALIDTIRQMPDGVICDLDERAYTQALAACEQGEQNWPNHTLPFYLLRQALTSARAT